MRQKEFKKELIEALPELYKFAMTLTENRDEAKDLIQETSVKALYNIENYRKNTNFKGWINTIMYRTFINNCKEGYKKHRINENERDKKQDLLTIIIYTEYGNHIFEIINAVNSLKREYREPLEMHIAGYKYQEIAQILSLNLGTVKSRIFKAREKLKRMLEGYFN